jgi:hypothetical protein
VPSSCPAADGNSQKFFGEALKIQGIHIQFMHLLAQVFNRCQRLLSPAVAKNHFMMPNWVSGGQKTKYLRGRGNNHYNFSG